MVRAKMLKRKIAAITLAVMMSSNILPSMSTLVNASQIHSRVSQEELHIEFEDGVDNVYMKEYGKLKITNNDGPVVGAQILLNGEVVEGVVTDNNGEVSTALLNLEVGDFTVQAVSGD